VTLGLALSLAAFAFLFDFGRAFVARPSRIFTSVILLVPLLGCGLARVREKAAGTEEEAEGL